MVRSGTLSGTAGHDSGIGRGLHLFCNFRRDGADLCDVSDTDLCELLCDVLKYRNAAA